MPNNIMLSFPTYFCEGCKEADIETIDYEGTDTDGYPVKVVQIQCKHESACRRIIDKYIDADKEGEQE